MYFGKHVELTERVPYEQDWMHEPLREQFCKTNGYIQQIEEETSHLYNCGFIKQLSNIYGFKNFSWKATQKHFFEQDVFLAASFMVLIIMLIGFLLSFPILLITFFIMILIGIIISNNQELFLKKRYDSGMQDMYELGKLRMELIYIKSFRAEMGIISNSYDSVLEKYIKTIDTIFESIIKRYQTSSMFSRFKKEINKGNTNIEEISKYFFKKNIIEYNISTEITKSEEHLKEKIIEEYTFEYQFNDKRTGVFYIKNLIKQIKNNLDVDKFWRKESSFEYKKIYKERASKLKDLEEIQRKYASESNNPIFELFLKETITKYNEFLDINWMIFKNTEEKKEFIAKTTVIKNSVIPQEYKNQLIGKLSEIQDIQKKMQLHLSSPKDSVYKSIQRNIDVQEQSKSVISSM